MAVDPALMGQPSTAADPSAAREAHPETESAPRIGLRPVSGQANTESAATTEAAEAPPPFDIDAYYAQYESAPEDVRQKLTERLLQAEPIRKQVSAESSRAIQRAQQQAQQAQAQRDELELDYILTDENHPRHYEELEKNGTSRQSLAEQRIGIRTAIERPEVRGAARVEVGQYLVSGLMASGAFPDVSADDWADALQAPDLVAALGVVKAKQHAADKAAWLKDFEPAIAAKTLDDYRAGLPNPDPGRSVAPSRAGLLTAARLREMRATGDPALKNVTAGEIDRIVADDLARLPH